MLIMIDGIFTLDDDDKKKDFYKMLKILSCIQIQLKDNQTFWKKKIQWSFFGHLIFPWTCRLSTHI